MYKIKVCFFASLREQLAMESTQVVLSKPLSVLELKEKITAQYAQGSHLLDKGIQASIDFEFARDQDIIDPETVNEVAFFPPVTGG
ncbi:MoaD/ThiS family protein [Marinomonas agarivorans]|nr:MoaD/ThiS family protein [Marinomonas agarivorans]